jgi:hypothetical protein
MHKGKGCHKGDGAAAKAPGSIHRVFSGMLGVIRGGAEGY